MSNIVILKKNVFWSMLEYELPIPLESQKIYNAITGHRLDVGGRHDIKLIIEGKMYDAYFRNEAFNRNVFEHQDIVMLKYGIKVKNILKRIFAISYSNMLMERERIMSSRDVNDTRRVTIPDYDNPDEYIILSATDNPDVFALDCITKDISDEAKKQIRYLKEEEFESDLIFNAHDNNAGFRYSEGVRKIRKLDCTIGDSLKKLYGYRCQMTGEFIGEKYGVNCVEAHHIAPFTKSLNNNTSNIIILSPNYHRIVHKTNPEWIASEKAFVFPNGLKEIVQLNKHL